MKNVIKTFILLAFFGLSSLVNAQWQQTNGPYGGNINCIASDGTNIFAGTNGQGVFLSSNNGSSWTAVNNGLPGWSPVYSFAISGTNIFAGIYGGVFLSSNNGSSWTAVNNGLTNNTVSSLAISGTNIFAGTYGDGVFLSSNNGSSWTAVNNGLPANTDVYSFAISGTNIFAGTNVGVFLSSNNGTSWTAVNNGLTNTIVLSLAISGSNIFAGTDGGGVWKRALSEMGIEENNYKSNITLYPNPANNKVTITNNNLPAKETTISIFNIQGELMLSEKFKEQNAIELNISKFAGGIYILKIQIGNEIENKKLVIQ